MPAAAINWNAAVQVAAAGKVGGLLHYYTEQAQAMYLAANHMETRIMAAPEGQYGALGAADVVDDGHTFNTFRLDHAGLGVAFGGAAIAGPAAGLYLFSYMYAADAGAWIKTGTITPQADNPITALGVTFKNIDNAYFNQDSSIFSPGNKITIRLSVGSSGEWYDMGEYFIDQMPWNDITDSFTGACRSAAGLYLKDVSFGALRAYSGRLDATVYAILIDGLGDVLPDSKILIQADARAVSITFDRAESRLEGLAKWLRDKYTWEIRRRNDGALIVGNLDFQDSINPSYIYRFTRELDCITYSGDRCIDGAYAKVCVYDPDEKNPAVYADIPTFEGWAVPPNKIFYYEAGKDTAASAYAGIASDLAARMAHIGIEENIYGYIRPWLKPGDVAQIYRAAQNDYYTTGALTQAAHTFGSDGWFSNLTTDSGGAAEAVAGDANRIKTSLFVVNGANRKRRITDFIRQQTNNAKVIQVAQASQTLSGYVAGPAAADNGTLPVFDGLTGRLIKQGPAIITALDAAGDDVNIPTEKAVTDALDAITRLWHGATVNANPTEIFLNGVNGARLALAAGEGVAFTILVMCYNSALPKGKAWSLSGAAYKPAAGPAVMMGSQPAALVIGDDTIAAGVAVGITADGLAITVTGTADAFTWQARGLISKFTI